MQDETTGSRIQDVKEKISAADMVLIGLGEEFDSTRNMRAAEDYGCGKKLLEDPGFSSLIPMWQGIFRDEMEETDRIKAGLHRLADCLAEKNYFVVSVSTNGDIAGIPWREGRLVMPCGSDRRWQCTPSCGEHLRPVSDGEGAHVRAMLQNWRAGGFDSGLLRMDVQGDCPACKNRLELNNVYSTRYDEQGYLREWQNYTKWLQGTLNKKLVVLELGVGMRFPSVIRFPFEKIAYFNQKAKFYRVHESLYQLTEELSEKGMGIAKNAIDWLQDLC